MSITSLLTDLYESFTIPTAHAEAPPAEVESEQEAVEEPVEEEEEEEEPEDPMPSILEECEKTEECAPVKHHYDECVARVTAAAEDPNSKSNEDCVEEFFHLMHCTTACAAPKLWKELK